MNAIWVAVHYQEFVTWGLNQAVTSTDYVFDMGSRRGLGRRRRGGNAIAWDDTNSHDALSMDDLRITNANAAVSNQSVTIVGYDAKLYGHS